MPSAASMRRYASSRWCAKVLEGGDAGKGLHACSGKRLPGVRLRVTERLSMAGSR